ncbi:MAG: helix-hairpin-helix domain-containing protein [Desulfatiglans sp.]|jgi:competence protein ComEA|nr:helix-hairpin-helix domain-containing protein [Thermodesulfobacteriota bacterium]MEE4353275.1 helix-hairpin-helix domain-containing protein [Desulfatiglans sp.]
MMIKKRKANDFSAGGLLLLFFLLSIQLMGSAARQPLPVKPPLTENVFVQISGDVVHPGVFGFQKPPRLDTLIILAGGLKRPPKMTPPVAGEPLPSGKSVDVRSDRRDLQIVKGDMSAFYRVTLGIPLSLNRETLEGLTAIPGIGRKTASAIVRARMERNGFADLDGLLSVPGIGPLLFKKISPYLSCADAGTDI